MWKDYQINKFIILQYILTAFHSANLYDIFQNEAIKICKIFPLKNLPYEGEANEASYDIFIKTLLLKAKYKICLLYRFIIFHNITIKKLYKQQYITRQIQSIIY